MAQMCLRMNRAGKVLSAALRQGAGSHAFDRPALETLERGDVNKGTRGDLGFPALICALYLAVHAR
jgi:hypothetical protein